MKNLIIILTLFGIVIFWNYGGINLGSIGSNNSSSQSIDSPIPKAFEKNNHEHMETIASEAASLGSFGFDCDDPDSNEGYLSVAGEMLEIIIVDVVDTISLPIDDMTIIKIKDTKEVEIKKTMDLRIEGATMADSGFLGVLDDLADVSKVVEVAFCSGNVYVKSHTKPLGLLGHDFCSLSLGTSRIKCFKTAVNVDLDLEPTTDECSYSPFGSGGDINYFLFTERVGGVLRLNFRFSL